MCGCGFAIFLLNSETTTGTKHLEKTNSCHAGNFYICAVNDSWCYTERTYSVFTIWRENHIQISNISRARSQTLNVSRLGLQLSLPNPLKPGVKSRMKMYLEQHRQAIGGNKIVDHSGVVGAAPTLGFNGRLHHLIIIIMQTHLKALN